MLENVSAPVKALIGPWDHFFPHSAWPGASIEWRHEAVRWWDHWLKDKDTGIMDEPAFAVFVRGWHPPDPGLKEVPGQWRWEEGWPIERARQEVLYAHPDNSLRSEPGQAATHLLDYKASIGLEGGGPVMWWGGITPDQQPLDDDCLVYDSAPLEEPLEILGFIRALLPVSADAPRANWVVRSSDVSPDGQVTMVTGAAFNGTHRQSAREPSDLVPGETIQLDLEMQFTSWVFSSGHSIRLAVSNSQWPMLWPTPFAMTTKLELGGQNGARLLLPVVPAEERPVPSFQTPAPYAALPGFETLDAGNVTGYGEIKSVERDPVTGEAFGVATNSGGTRYPWGTERFEERIEHRTSDRNPAETSVRGLYALTQELADRTLRFEQDLVLRSDAENFRLTVTRRLLVDGDLVRQKEWDEIIPRDFQ